MNQYSLLTTLTPDGEFHMVIDQNSFVVLSGYGSSSRLLRRLKINPETVRTIKKHHLIDLVNQYYEGNFESIKDIPTRQSGTKFQLEVWDKLSKIPVGKTLSYKDLAISIKNQSAFRAVANACRANKLILLIPCHRVTGSNGHLGGYLYGINIKKSLLDLETNTNANI